VSDAEAHRDRDRQLAAVYELHGDTIGTAIGRLTETRNRRDASLIYGALRNARNDWA